MLLLVAGVLTAGLAAVGFLADVGRVDSDEAWAGALFAGALLLIEIGTGCLRWLAIPAGARTPASWRSRPGLARRPLLRRRRRLRQLAAQRRLAAAAIAQRDRQRLARDLHDGLCQDLAFIASHCAGFAGTDGDEHPIALAARRALAASRGTLAELSASDAPDIAQALRRVASELAIRFGIAVEVRAQVVRLRDGEREAIVRTMREAVVNAARHGGAQQVLVTFEPETAASCSGSRTTAAESSPTPRGGRASG